MSTVTEFLAALETGAGNFETSGFRRDTRTNERGNLVVMTYIGGDRYRFDFDEDFMFHGGWEQADTEQDASYFGAWINREKRHLLTFAEGDLTLVVCPDVESYNAEVRAFIDFHGQHCYAGVTTIDRDGKTTRYTSDNARFLILDGEAVAR